ncbi:MAG: MFS transporter permease [Halioglobus sp.]|nr:MFS transporter permease [Halioglobus sp.]
MSRTLPSSDAIYQLLVEDEDARVCKDIPDAACNEQPRAFLAQVGAQTLTKIGDALTSSRLVLAWMMAAIGAPGYLVALLVPIRESLSLLPQLFIAQWMREHPVRKWFWVGGSLGQALALCGMVAALLLPLPGDGTAWAIVVLLALFSLSRGVCSVAAKDVLGKTISKSRRGRLTGIAASIAGLVTLAVALLLWLFPRWGETGSGDVDLFAVILAVAALLWCVAAAIYALTPEVPGATAGGGNAIGTAWKSLSLLRRDADFRAFLVGRILLVATAFAIPYIVVLLQRAGNGDGGALAVLLFAEGSAGLWSGRFWGRWSDAAAHRVMAAAATMGAALLGAVLLIDAVAPAWLANPVTAFTLFFLAAVAHQGARVGRKTYLVDMANADNRAQYTAVSNTVMGVFLLGGAALGAVETLLGLNAVLLLLLLVSLLGIWRCATLRDVSG